MSNPLVSVIIPAYNGAKYIGDAIQSVLDQTYPYFELFVVDDGSRDNTAEVVGRFTDSRLKYIVHEDNKGVGKARNTALHASSGEIIAFLDQDDFYHPEKLQAHVRLYELIPENGFTYNARFELNYSTKTPRDISRPPKQLSLANLVLGFPLSPSDVVVRREWALRMDMLHSVQGAEITHYGRMYMEGCKFGMIDRALNYRRFHSRRRINNIVACCQAEIYNQDLIFTDPRCPPDLSSLRGTAHANLYMYWAYMAFAQDEVSIGQKYMREAVHDKPSILQDDPCELLVNILINCVDDETVDHQMPLKKVLERLPSEISWLAGRYPWAVAQGYLLKGAREIIWGRTGNGHTHFGQALKLGARFNESFMNTLVGQLVNYEIEFGTEAASEVLSELSPDLLNLGGPDGLKKITGSYYINKAFHHYHAGELIRVRGDIFRAVTQYPKYLTNPGVLAMLRHSIF